MQPMQQFNPGGSRFFGVSCCRALISSSEKLGSLVHGDGAFASGVISEATISHGRASDVHSPQPRRLAGRSILAVHPNKVRALERAHLETGAALFSRAVKSTIGGDKTPLGSRLPYGPGVTLS